MGRSTARRIGLLVVGITTGLGMSDAGAQAPVETATYLTGAWGSPLTEDQRALYLQAGFNLVRYIPKNAEWAQAHGLYSIASVSSWGMPKGVNRPFEAHDGTMSNSVGLFTHVNFSAPSVAEWWQTRVPELVRNMSGAERVAFWKVHNEFGYHSWKVHDYSPGSVARYRLWLKERYAGIEVLNRRWSAQFADFAEVTPPRADFEEQPANWLEWRRFTCSNFADYFRSTGDLIRHVVPGARVSDNFYPTSPLHGWNLFELARETDYLALDIYAIGRWPALLERLDLGRCAAAAGGKPFVMMEYHAGPNHWAPVVRARDLTIEASVALARECRALMWYMWRPGQAGREQGIHGMLDMQGNPTERYTAVAEVSAFTARLAPVLECSRVVADVAVVTSCDNAYLAYAQRRNQHQDSKRWNVLGHLLDAARIQFDFVDPVDLLGDGLSRYRAIIVGHLPVLSDAALAKLRGYAEAGGAVVFHPDVGMLNEFGHPRADVGSTSDASGAWTVRDPARSGGSPAVEGLGKGRFVHCSWELPENLGESDIFMQRSRVYAALLADTAGVSPALEVRAEVPAADLDARRLLARDLTLVVLTHLGQGLAGDVRVDVPGVGGCETAYLLTPRSAAVRRLPVRSLDEGGGSFVVPEVDPSAVVLVGGAWQPLLGLDAPKVLHPGETVDVTVTVDNLGAQHVSGHVRLRVPKGWELTPASGGQFSELERGVRASVRFNVHVPAGASVDRFALDYPLVAEVTFTDGRTGTLTARHLPFLLPALDILVEYQDRLLNPWQELTPPLLRWGWNNEVHTAPPPPIACAADTPVLLRVNSAGALKGEQLELSLSGHGSASVSVASGDASVLSGGEQAVPVVFRVETPGEFRLQARAGGVQAEALVRVGVERETVEQAVATAQATCPEGWRPIGLLGVGARGAPANGAPATCVVSLPEAETSRATVFRAAAGADGTTAALVAAVVQGDSVSVSADVPEDGVSVYTVAVPGGEDGTPYASRVKLETEGDRLTVRGDVYGVTFNSDLGLVESMDVAGHRVLRHRTGVVVQASDGGEWAPDGSSTCSSMGVATSHVGATVEFEHMLGPHESGLVVRELWQFEPSRMAVALKIMNQGRSPLVLPRISYELGVDPELFPHWRRLMAEGQEQTGELPTGFGAASGVEVTDWLDAAGRGMALTLGRCAQNMRWASIANSVRHSPARTEILLVHGAAIDPDDFVLAEFELWPHGEARVGARSPVLVTAFRALGHRD